MCPRAGLAKASRAGGYWSFVQPVRRRGRRRPPGAAARARQAGALSPPPAAGPGALSPSTVGLAKLVVLIVDCTLIADAGCAALISALDSGALPALEHLTLGDTRDSPTSPTAVAAVGAALANQVSVLRAKGARAPQASPTLHPLAASAKLPVPRTMASAPDLGNSKAKIRQIMVKAHTRPLTMVKYNREGDLLLTTGKDHTPSIYYADNGERIGTYDGHNGTVWCVDINCALPSWS